MRSWILLALAAVAVGCNPTDAGNLTKDVGDLTKHAAQAAGSAQLATRVNAVLVQRKGVNMKGLHIEAKDGIVTVGGYVRDEAERKRVVETVDGIRGVEKVVDRLRIQPG